VATTESVTLTPEATDWLTGCVVMAGSALAEPETRKPICVGPKASPVALARS